jgi:Sap, sulfolipid-1-addressing protein
VSEQLFLQLLALGLLTSVTPWGIVAVIVLLSAKSGPRGAVAFIAGWVASILLTGGLIIGTYSGARSRPGSSAGNAMLGIQFVLGVLLLVLAARRWSRRITADPGTIEPKWLRALDRMRPIVAFGLGMFWVNLVLVVAAAIAVADAGLGHTKRGTRLSALRAARHARRGDDTRRLLRQSRTGASASRRNALMVDAAQCGCRVGHARSGRSRLVFIVRGLISLTT